MALRRHLGHRPQPPWPALRPLWRDSIRATAELAVRRLLAAFAVILGAGGVPMVFLGDEIAQLSDHSHLADPDLADDNRWSQRPRF